MPFKKIIFLTLLFSLVFFSYDSKSQDYYDIIGNQPATAQKTASTSNPISDADSNLSSQEKVKESNISNTKPVEVPFEDPHLSIVGWDGRVPLKYLLSAIQEGVTDQLTILRLFSAPNIITRSDQEKETWVYHWIWSYNNTKNPDTTLILMDHQGLRLKNNKKPVSLSLVFNDKNVVESYSLKLLKVRHDAFYEH